MKKVIILIVLLLTQFSHAHSVQPQKMVVIVANSIDYSANYKQFFEKNDTLVFYAPPPKFSQFKQYANILIIGGPDAPETREVVRQALTDSEMTFLRQKGNAALFEKRNVWKENQRVFIIGGWDRYATSNAVWEHIAYISSSLLDSEYLSMAGEIQWMKDDFQGGLARAKREDRLMLVYIWASWCAWCEKMKGEVFTDAQVKEVITQYYVPVRLDFDKAKNADFAHRNYVWGMPAFLVFDGDGKKVGFMDGFQEKERFLTRLLRYISP